MVAGGKFPILPECGILLLPSIAYDDGSEGFEFECVVFVGLGEMVSTSSYLEAHPSKRTL